MGLRVDAIISFGQSRTRYTSNVDEIDVYLHVAVLMAGGSGAA